MNKHGPALFCLASLLISPVSARAVPTQSTYLTMLGGFQDGTLNFQLDSEIDFGCRYVAVWEAPDRNLSAQCYVDELTGGLQSSCETDAFRPVAAMLTLSPIEKCFGFDGEQDGGVFLFVLGESVRNGELDGVVQFYGPTTAPTGIRAIRML